MVKKLNYSESLGYSSNLSRNKYSDLYNNSNNYKISSKRIVNFRISNNGGSISNTKAFHRSTCREKASKAISILINKIRLNKILQEEINEMLVRKIKIEIGA